MFATLILANSTTLCTTTENLPSIAQNSTLTPELLTKKEPIKYSHFESALLSTAKAIFMKGTSTDTDNKTLLSTILSLKDSSMSKKDRDKLTVNVELLSYLSEMKKKLLASKENYTVILNMYKKFLERGYSKNNFDLGDPDVIFSKTAFDMDEAKNPLSYTGCYKICSIIARLLGVTDFESRTSLIREIELQRREIIQTAYIPKWILALTKKTKSLVTDLETLKTLPKHLAKERASLLFGQIMDVNEQILLCNNLCGYPWKPTSSAKKINEYLRIFSADTIDGNNINLMIVYQTLIRKTQELIKLDENIFPEILIMVPTCNRNKPLRDFLDSVIEELNLFCFEKEKIKIVIFDDSTETAEILQNMQLKQQYEQKGLAIEYVSPIDQINCIRQLANGSREKMATLLGMVNKSTFDITRVPPETKNIDFVYQKSTQEILLKWGRKGFGGIRSMIQMSMPNYLPKHDNFIVWAIDDDMLLKQTVTQEQIFTKNNGSDRIPANMFIDIHAFSLFHHQTYNFYRAKNSVFDISMGQLETTFCDENVEKILRTLIEHGYIKKNTLYTLKKKIGSEETIDIPGIKNTDKRSRTEKKVFDWLLTYKKNPNTIIDISLLELENTFCEPEYFDQILETLIRSGYIEEKNKNSTYLLTEKSLDPKNLGKIENIGLETKTSKKIFSWLKQYQNLGIIMCGRYLSNSPMAPSSILDGFMDVLIPLTEKYQQLCLTRRLSDTYDPLVLSEQAFSGNMSPIIELDFSRDNNTKTTNLAIPAPVVTLLEKHILQDNTPIDWISFFYSTLQAITIFPYGYDVLRQQPYTPVLPKPLSPYVSMMAGGGNIMYSAVAYRTFLRYLYFGHRMEDLSSQKLIERHYGYPTTDGLPSTEPQKTIIKFWRNGVPIKHNRQKEYRDGFENTPPEKINANNIWNELEKDREGRFILHIFDDFFTKIFSPSGTFKKIRETLEMPSKKIALQIDTISEHLSDIKQWFIKTIREPLTMRGFIKNSDTDCTTIFSSIALAEEHIQKLKIYKDSNNTQEQAVFVKRLKSTCFILELQCQQFCAKEFPHLLQCLSWEDYWSEYPGGYVIQMLEEQTMYESFIRKIISNYKKLEEVCKKITSYYEQQRIFDSYSALQKKLVGNAILPSSAYTKFCSVLIIDFFTESRNNITKGTLVEYIKIIKNKFDERQQQYCNQLLEHLKTISEDNSVLNSDINNLQFLNREIEILSNLQRFASYIKDFIDRSGQKYNIQNISQFNSQPIEIPNEVHSYLFQYIPYMNNIRSLEIRDIFSILDHINYRQLPIEKLQNLDKNTLVQLLSSEEEIDQMPLLVKKIRTIPSQELENMKILLITLKNISNFTQEDATLLENIIYDNNLIPKKDDYFERDFSIITKEKLIGVINSPTYTTADTTNTKYINLRNKLNVLTDYQITHLLKALKGFTLLKKQSQWYSEYVELTSATSIIIPPAIAQTQIQRQTLDQAA